MIRTSALAQAVLEGVTLPAQRRQLIAYAIGEGADPGVLRALRLLPDDSYGSLDEVGEAIAPVQPVRVESERMPEPESGPPPGGDGYAD